MDAITAPRANHSSSLARPKESEITRSSIASNNSELTEQAPPNSPDNDAVVVEITGESDDSSSSATTENESDENENKEVEELKRRDREVRTHEQAHLSALGKHQSGGATFTFAVGPDGKPYATSGEVSVDVSPEDTPEKTIEKAQTIRRAALAPQNPSGADRSVAAKASQMEAQAKAELLARDRPTEQSAPSPTEGDEKTNQVETSSSNTPVVTAFSSAKTNDSPCPICGAPLESGHSHFNEVA